MDDLAIMARIVPKGKWILEDLCKTIWSARMEFKPSKSRSLVLRKGCIENCFQFRIGEEPIPTVSERPVKSLRKWYKTELNDRVCRRCFAKLKYG